VEKTTEIKPEQTAIKGHLSGIVAYVKTAKKSLTASLKKAIKRNPLTSFLVLLGILLLLIIVGNFLRKPKAAQQAQEKRAFQSKTYVIGSAPTMQLTGKVEKTGVITMVAQSAGIVQKVHVTVGDEVRKGKTLVSLSTSYSGGSIPSIQRQLAQTQFTFTEDTFQTQKDLVGRQRELANEQWQNTDELRKISDKTLGDTRDQISINESILSTISDNLKTLEEATDSADNADLILATKQMKAQYMGVVGQLKQASRALEYQVDTNNPPSKLAELQRDLTLKQLDVQEKSLDLNKEINQLNLRIARVAESLMYPSSPFAGTVERIHVRPGQAVSPGTPIISLTGAPDQFDVVVMVPEEIRNAVSQLEPSTVFIDQQQITSYPLHVSTEPIYQGLYAVTYHIPVTYEAAVHEGENLTITVPLGYPDTGAVTPTVPLHAIHQFQDYAQVFVLKDNKAEAKTVKLGSVFGGYIEVTEGLSDGDEILLNRSVVSGSAIEKL